MNTCDRCYENHVTRPLGGSVPKFADLRLCGVNHCFSITRGDMEDQGYPDFVSDEDIPEARS